MDKITIKKDSRVLFIGDSITDVKFNFRLSRKIKGRKSCTNSSASRDRECYGNCRGYKRDFSVSI